MMISNVVVSMEASFCASARLHVRTRERSVASCSHDRTSRSLDLSAATKQKFSFAPPVNVPQSLPRRRKNAALVEVCGSLPKTRCSFVPQILWACVNTLVEKLLHRLSVRTSGVQLFV